MSKLYDFLHPVAVQEEREVVVSRRFVQRDEKGEPILGPDGEAIHKPFRVRAISQAENDALVKAATMSYRDRTGAKVQNFDRQKYVRSLIVAGTKDPDFREKELCDAFCTLDPEEVPGKMLYAGEFQKLADAISELSGFDDGDVEGEAKN